MKEYQDENVLLMQSDIDYAHAFGALRQRYAELADLPPSNASPADPVIGLAWHRQSMCTEYAAYLYFRPCRWVHFVGNPDGEADIGYATYIFIDVKGRGERWNHLIIQPRKLNNNFAYLMVFADRHPLYEIGPWCWGRDVVGHPTSARGRKGGDAYYIEQTDPIMKPPGQLREILRKRQQSFYKVEDLRAEGVPFMNSVGEIRPEARGRGIK